MAYIQGLKSKQGPAVFLSLTGQARDCVRDLQPQEIGQENGVKNIIDKLDTLFLKDENLKVENLKVELSLS